MSERIERRRAPKIISGMLALGVGVASIAGCIAPKERRADASPAASAAASASAPNKGGPDPNELHCDFAHRAQEVQQTSDGKPIVRVDSRCTDPSNPNAGVYSTEGPASQAQGIAKGSLPNGTLVVALCRTVGQRITNDKGVPSIGWDKVQPLPNQDMILPDGTEVRTTPMEEYYIPNMHLGLYNDIAIPVC